MINCVTLEDKNIDVCARKSYYDYNGARACMTNNINSCNCNTTRCNTNNCYSCNNNRCNNNCSCNTNRCDSCNTNRCCRSNSCNANRCNKNKRKCNCQCDPCCTRLLSGLIPEMVPYPPLPPCIGPIFGRAQFRAPARQMSSGDFYSFKTETIQGNAILPVDGTSEITLAPNTTFDFVWVISSPANTKCPISIGAILLLNNIQISQSVCRGACKSDLRACASGRFMTGNTQSTLKLVYVSDVATTNLSGAVLMITSI